MARERDFSYPIPDADGPDERQHRLQIARVLISVMRGKLNATKQTITLTANATTTTLTDERIGPYSFIDFMAITANASTARPGLYVSAQTAGSATLKHDNSANADQNFRVLILG